MDDTHPEAVVVSVQKHDPPRHDPPPPRSAVGDAGGSGAGAEALGGEEDYEDETNSTDHEYGPSISRRQNQIQWARATSIGNLPVDGIGAPHKSCRLSDVTNSSAASGGNGDRRIRNALLDLSDVINDEDSDRSDPTAFNFGQPRDRGGAHPPVPPPPSSPSGTGDADAPSNEPPFASAPDGRRERRDEKRIPLPSSPWLGHLPGTGARMAGMPELSTHMSSELNHLRRSRTGTTESTRNRGWTPCHDATLRKWKCQAFVYMQIQQRAHHFYLAVYNALSLPGMIMNLVAGLLVNTNDHRATHIVVAVLALGSVLLSALVRQIRPAELSQDHSSTSAYYHILLHSMESCMRVPFHMRPDAMVYMEKLRNDMDRLTVTQSSPPSFVVRAYEKKVGRIDGIMYGEDVVEVMVNNARTNAVLQKLQQDSHGRQMDAQASEVINAILRRGR